MVAAVSGRPSTSTCPGSRGGCARTSDTMRLARRGPMTSSSASSAAPWPCWMARRP
jgi:hypothetical protein